MKAIIQRVSGAEVHAEGKLYARIGKGMLVLLGVEKGDTDHDVVYICKKISQLRIFEDSNHKMNLSVIDIKGEILVISQFTLAARCRKGNRPSFDQAEEPGRAEEIYAKCIDILKQNGITVRTGEFGAHMSVHLTNDGPVTIILDSRN